ncbi:MAG TPA: hypothetical protein VKX30_03615 [Flavobacteriaceae bacterium]|nr:hypothetical protein [Flavobacteriaceae bacterium]
MPTRKILAVAEWETSMMCENSTIRFCKAKTTYPSKANLLACGTYSLSEAKDYSVTFKRIVPLDRTVFYRFTPTLKGDDKNL